MAVWRRRGTMGEFEKEDIEERKTIIVENTICLWTFDSVFIRWH
jgi:hypothetical protein